jgi:Transcriptional regulatory protein, C terminal
MNRPMTDRERALRAEARVAELEEELAAYKANERALASEIEEGQEYLICLDIIKTLPIDQRCKMPGVIKLLIYISQHPGRVCSKLELLELISSDKYEVQLTVVDVYISFVRKVARALGLPDAIETIWGRGWLIREDQAVCLRMALHLPLRRRHA